MNERIQKLEELCWQELGEEEGMYPVFNTKKFAALAAAQERDECAKLCEDIDSTKDYYGPRVELVCAEAIRARGEV